jgi:peptidoglycan hydrolase-like protein with peptidoglycan-binding domain
VGLLAFAAAAFAKSAALKQGSHGSSVRQLQRELHKIGLDVDVDGVYGSSTANAVQVFQHATNIDVTGVANHPTRHLLHNVIKRSAASATASAMSSIRAAIP